MYHTQVFSAADKILQHYTLHTSRQRSIDITIIAIRRGNKGNRVTSQDATRTQRDQTTVKKGVKKGVLLHKSDSMSYQLVFSPCYETGSDSRPGDAAGVRLFGLLFFILAAAT